MTQSGVGGVDFVPFGKNKASYETDPAELSVNPTFHAITVGFVESILAVLHRRLIYN